MSYCAHCNTENGHTPTCIMVWQGTPYDRLLAENKRLQAERDHLERALIAEQNRGPISFDLTNAVKNERLQAVLGAAREIRALASGAYHGTYSVSSEKFKQLMDAIRAYDEWRRG